MQQIIDEVLKAEKNADKIIQETRRSVTELKKRIESENSQKISMAQNEAQKLVQNSIAMAKIEAEEAYKLAMKQIEEKNADFMNTIEKNYDITIDTIMNLITSPEYTRE